MPRVPVAGVTGWPIEQSKSPVIHQFWLEKLGIPGRFIRVPAPPPCTIEDAVTAFMKEAAMAGLEPRGLNVTMPLKEMASRFGQVDYDTHHTGSSNCLVLKTDGWHSFNHDAAGFDESLGPGRQWVGKEMLLFGIGGAARSVLLAAERRGFKKATVISRNIKRAKKVMEPYMRRMAIDFLTSNFPMPRVDMLVNATPLGMAGFAEFGESHMSREDWERQSDRLVVYDLVTRDTNLQRVARRRGLRTIPGTAMLIEQARFSFEEFFGEIPPSHWDAELKSRLVDSAA